MNYTAQQAIELAMLCILVGREGRNQAYSAMLGKAWTVRNRVEKPRYWGTDWLSAIEHLDAYSSMTVAGDPNLVVWPVLPGAVWQMCLQAAETAYAGSGPDPVCGATHYFDPPAQPYWATAPGTQFISQIGTTRFYIAD